MDEEEYWDTVFKKECLSVLKHLNHTDKGSTFNVIYRPAVGERGEASR